MNRNAFSSPNDTTNIFIHLQHFGGPMYKPMNATDAYTRMFREYPDVIDVQTLRKMLGNIGVKSVYRLLSSNQIASIRIGRTYRIPKVCVIDYLCQLSENSPHSCGLAANFVN